MKPVLTPAEARELDRATQARGRPGGRPDGARGAGRGPGRGRGGRRRLRSARRRRLRQGQQRRRRVRRRAAPGAPGRAGRRRRRSRPSDGGRGRRDEPRAPGRAGPRRRAVRRRDRPHAPSRAPTSSSTRSSAPASAGSPRARGPMRSRRSTPRRRRWSPSTSRRASTARPARSAGAAVWAELTVAFGAAKVGTVLLPGAERAGTVRVVDIGFPDDLVRADVVARPSPSDVAGGAARRGRGRAQAQLRRAARGRRIPSDDGRARADRARGRPRRRRPRRRRDAATTPCRAVQAHVAEAIFLPLAADRRGHGRRSMRSTAARGGGRADAVAIGPGLTRTDRDRRLVASRGRSLARCRSCSTPTG